MYFITYNLTVFLCNVSSFPINEISKLNMPKHSPLSLPFLFKLFFTGTLPVSKNNAFRTVLFLLVCCPADSTVCLSLVNFLYFLCSIQIRSAFFLRFF